MKYIYHHLGLGDHIICNGMIRHFYNLHGSISLFCKEHNRSNIEYMYRDLKDIQIISFDDGLDADLQCKQYIHQNNLYNDLIKIGFEKMNSSLSESFDKDFYRIADLPFSIRFDEFYIKRSPKNEKLVLETLNPNNEKFIFVHDDPDRGFVIDESKISTKYKIIKNDKNFLVFNYIKLLEKAEEVHFMQSSFKELICSYDLKKTKLYQHNYVRQYDSYMNSVGVNPITEIN